MGPCGQPAAVRAAGPALNAGADAWHSHGRSAKEALSAAARRAIFFEAMPIYEYRCSDGHAFEVIQRFSDDPIEACEMCGKPAARVYHPPAVHFKGSGFYNTDYGTRKRAKEKEATGEGSSANGSAQSNGKAGSGGEGSSAASKSANGKSQPAKAAA